MLPEYFWKLVLGFVKLASFVKFWDRMLFFLILEFLRFIDNCHFDITTIDGDATYIELSARFIKVLSVTSNYCIAIEPPIGEPLIIIERIICRAAAFVIAIAYSILLLGVIGLWHLIHSTSL